MSLAALTLGAAAFFFAGFSAGVVAVCVFAKGFLKIIVTGA